MGPGTNGYFGCHVTVPEIRHSIQGRTEGGSREDLSSTGCAWVCVGGVCVGVRGWDVRGCAWVGGAWVCVGGVCVGVRGWGVHGCAWVGCAWVCVGGVCVGVRGRRLLLEPWACALWGTIDSLGREIGRDATRPTPRGHEDTQQRGGVAT